MRTIEICRSWVVYRMAASAPECSAAMSCVRNGNGTCWNAPRPGFHVLIRNGIGSEQEAEKLRVAQAGDSPSRKPPTRKVTNLQSGPSL